MCIRDSFDTLNVILVDFKLEFGKTADGKIVLADEMCIRDSSILNSKVSLC